MIALAYFGLAVLFVIGQPVSQLRPDDEQQQITMPDEPGTVIVTLDFKGGYLPPRRSDDPTVSVLADGTVLVPNTDSQTKAMAGRLSKTDLRKLVALILENEFFDYDEREVQQHIETLRRENEPRISEDWTTHISVQLGGRRRTITVLSLGAAAQRFPEIKPLRQMFAIQQELLRIKNVVHAGGGARLAQYLQLANQGVQQKFPGVRPLTLNDFETAMTHVNGDRYVRFFRAGPPADGQEGEFIHVTVFESASGKLKVTVDTQSQ